MGDTTNMDEERMQAREAKCQYLEGRIDTLERLFMNQQQQPQGALSQVRDQLNRDRREDHVWISGLTRNQHATLQMIRNGKSDDEIADRFGIGLSSAKSRSVSIRSKIGNALDVSVRNRNVLVKVANDAFTGMDAERYFAMAGIPMDWDDNWDESDRKTNADLYR